MAMQFISHNLAVITEIAHEIIVMYAGRIVERAPADALFANPLHPYTLGLIATLPDPATARRAAAGDPGRRARSRTPRSGLPLRRPLPARRRRLPRGRAAAGGGRARRIRRLLQGAPT